MENQQHATPQDDHAADQSVRRDSRRLYALLAVSVLFCWVRLSSDPPWFNWIGEFTDEAFYTANAQNVLKACPWQVGYLDQSWSSPLFQAILMAAGGAFGLHYATLKAISALAATGTLVLFAIFVRRHFGYATAVAATLLLSFNTIFFVVRRTFCPEAVQLCLLVPAYFLLLGERNRSFLASGILFAAVVAVKLSGAYAVPGALLFLACGLLARQVKLKQIAVFLAPLVVAAAAYALAYWKLHEQWAQSIQQQVDQSNANKILGGIASSLFVRLRIILSASMATTDPTLLLIVVASAVFLVRLLTARRELFALRNAAPEAMRLKLLLCWLVGPMAISIVNPEYMNRRLLHLLMPLCLLAAIRTPEIQAADVPAGASWKDTLSRVAHAALLIAVCAYAGWLVRWSVELTSSYFFRCRHDIFELRALPPIVRTCMLILVPGAVFLTFFCSFGFRAGTLGLVRRAFLVPYFAWWALCAGSCIAFPTYTVVDASRQLGRYVSLSHGDMMGFAQCEGNQGFVLCLENEAVPYFINVRHPEAIDERPHGLKMRLWTRTLVRRTPWEWTEIPRQATFDESLMEREPIILKLVPQPFGTFTHTVEVFVFK